MKLQMQYGCMWSAPQKSLSLLCFYNTMKQDNGA